MSVETRKHPKYLKAKNILRERIANRTYTDKKAVPPEKVLSGEFNMAPMTVRRAIQELVDEGVLIRQRGRGKGTYVRPDPSNIHPRINPATSSERLKRIGVLHEYNWLHLTGSPVYFMVFMSIQAECARRGIGLEFMPHDGMVHEGAAGLKRLAEKSSAQVVLVLDWHEPEELVELQNMGIPVVVPGPFHQSMPISWVAPNDFLSAATVTRHLLSIGHKHVGIVNTSKVNRVRFDREAGWATAHYQLGIDTESLPRYYCGKVDQQQVQLFEQLKDEIVEAFKKNPPPTALFARDGLYAWAAIRALREIGLRCPEDVSVGCVGMFFKKTLGMPEVTTAISDEGELGKCVLDLAERLLMGSASPGMGISMPAHLIKGQTSVPPKKKYRRIDTDKTGETSPIQKAET